MNSNYYPPDVNCSINPPIIQPAPPFPPAPPSCPTGCPRVNNICMDPNTRNVMVYYNNGSVVNSNIQANCCVPVSLAGKTCQGKYANTFIRGLQYTELGQLIVGFSDGSTCNMGNICKCQNIIFSQNQTPESYCASSQVIRCGEVFINLETGIVYRYTGQCWVIIGNLTGPQGPTGPIGYTGATGGIGPTGPTGLIMTPTVEVISSSTGIIDPQINVTIISGTGTYSLSNGPYNGCVKSIALSNNSVPSTFTNPSPFGSGLNNSSRCIAVVGTMLYVGGQFTSVNGNLWNYIAAFDTSTNTWSNPFGTGLNETAYAIAVYGTTLIVGGYFTTVNGVGCNRIVAFDTLTSSWSYIFGTGLNSTCSALEIDGTILYVGGSFTSAGGIACTRIAKFDLNTNTWSNPFGTGCNETVRAMKLVNSILYFGGEFTIVNGNSWNRIAVFDTMTSTLSNPFGTGLSDRVHSMAVIGTDLYVGGQFRVANNQPFRNIFKFDTITQNIVQISAFSRGMNEIVAAIQPIGTTLYITGHFTKADTLNVGYIVKFDTLTNVFSNPFGYGLNDNGYALNSIGSKIYVGGNMGVADMTIASCIAEFNDFPRAATVTGSFINGIYTYSRFTCSQAGDSAILECMYLEDKNTWVVENTPSSSINFFQ